MNILNTLIIGLLLFSFSAKHQSSTERPMAEVVRISGSEPPATPLLPQNIEAEAALLGALMIDNRLVEANEEIGLATVYRVLNQFESAGQLFHRERLARNRVGVLGQSRLVVF